MVKTQLTIELLKQFAQLLTNKRESFEQVKGMMDNALRSFLWNDPVARKFKDDYEKRLKPLKKKLLPAMERYEKYLYELADRTGLYSESGLRDILIGGLGLGLIGTSYLENKALWKGNIPSPPIIEDETLREQIKKAEGERENFYVCSAGKITIGIGNNVHDSESKFLKLKLLDTNGKELDTDAKKDLYKGMITLVEEDNKKEGKKLRTASGIKNTIPSAELKKISTDNLKKYDLENIHITKESMNKDLNTHLQDSIEELKIKFPKYDTYPAGAQKALLDMQYNIGGSFAEKHNIKGKDKWPNLFGAVEKGNWAEAAKQCNRRQLGNKLGGRNDTTKKWFLEAAEQDKRLFEITKKPLIDSVFGKDEKNMFSKI